VSKQLVRVRIQTN